MEIVLTGEPEPEDDGSTIIIGAENRVTPRYRSDVWRQVKDQRTKVLPAHIQPPPRREWRHVYRKLLRSSDANIKLLVDGKIGARDFIDRFDLDLEISHAQSWYLGRLLAGDDSPMGLGDALVGRASADQDGYYLQGFLKAIENDEYRDEDGNWEDDRIKDRARLYANKTRGTANEAFTENSPQDMEFEWTLGAAEHCPDCLDLAGMNPWLPDEMYVWPGDGNTVCITNCRCIWVREDGVRGFSPEH